ncbi:MAG: SH3 domain-containing protein [Thermomicrobiales bacterium]
MTQDRPVGDHASILPRRNDEHDHNHNHNHHHSHGHHHEQGPEDAPRPRRPVNRRIIMQAAAGLAAIGLAGGIGGQKGPAPAVSAQEAGGTRAGRFTPGTTTTFAAASADGFQSWTADYPFYALGANWNGSVGTWPVIEVQVSVDGATWSDLIRVAANTEDGGRPTREDRLFTPLIFTNGESQVRYRTVDQDGNPGAVDGLSFTYIDATDGPWAKDVDAANQQQTFVTASSDTRVPPTVVTRQAWGANESYRFDTYGEIWPPEYETVTHAIVHHTDTATAQDPVVAIRSIYYYHAVDQGWGDIGYNYLVDKNGRIYEGRYGGQNVIGGHSYEFAIGSSGISIIGDYQDVPPSNVSVAALISILSWVVRDLDPLGSGPIQEATNLPTIAGHRDVNATTCPGNMLYYDLPDIRSMVAQTLASGSLETNNPGGIAVRDRVIVQTDDGQPLNVRSTASPTATVVGQIANGDVATVIDGPVIGDTDNWYKIDWTGPDGWVSARYLIVSPPAPPPLGDGDYAYGVNVRYTTETNIRTQPSLSGSIIASVPRNAWAFVMAGPITADGYDWYQLRVQDVGDGWSVKSNFAAAPLDLNPTAKFAVGDTVMATTSINIRPRPGLAQTVVAMVGAGVPFTITRAPLSVTDFIWYGVFGSFGGGWVVENNLVLSSTPGGSGKFAIGDPIVVTSAVNFRSAPSTSASVITLLQAGATGTVVGGPQTANGYTWWQFRTSGGSVGWSIQDSLEKGSATTTTTTTPVPGAKFVVGDTLRVTDDINFRSAPGTSASIIAQLPAGTTGTVLAGPQSASGYVWYQFRTSGGTTGWGAQDWLAKTSGTTTTTTPAPAAKFAIGDSLQVTEAVNFRSAAGTSASVIAVLAAGTTGTVTGGPTSANGYVWWQFRTSGGTTGWAVQDWLAKTSGTTTTTTTTTSGPTTTTTAAPGGKFVIGDAIVATEAVNIRTGAGTSNPVVTFANAGGTATVIGGPQMANGMRWWNIQVPNGQSGWSIEDPWEKAGTTTTPAPGKFVIGDAIRVTEALNFRSAPSTSASVIAVLAAGTMGTVTGGPTSANGYVWWQFRTNGGTTGWAVQDWLTR